MHANELLAAAPKFHKRKEFNRGPPYWLRECLLQSFGHQALRRTADLAGLQSSGPDRAQTTACLRLLQGYLRTAQRGRRIRGESSSAQDRIRRETVFIQP